MSFYSKSNSSQESLCEGGASIYKSPLDALHSRVAKQSADLRAELTDLRETHKALLAALAEIDMSQLDTLESKAKEDMSSKDSKALAERSDWLDGTLIEVMTARSHLREIAYGESAVVSHAETDLDILDGFEFTPLYDA